MTTSTLLSAPATALPLSTGVRERLTADLVAGGYGADHASALTYELEKFLHLCSTSEEAYRPSRQVDDAWHVFILRTAEYAEYCSSLGRFIHHHVGDPGDIDAALDLSSTFGALVEAGLNPNLEMWGGGMDADCEAQCAPRCNIAPPPRH